jgi:hypothetical protein
MRVPLHNLMTPTARAPMWVKLTDGFAMDAPEAPRVHFDGTVNTQ